MNPANHDDRILDTSLEEVTGRVEPPDLVEKVRARLDGADTGPAMDSSPVGDVAVRTVTGNGSRGARWSVVGSLAGLAAAAGLLVWVGGGFGDPGGAGAVPRIELEVRVLRGEISWSGDGAVIERTGTHSAAAGQQFQLALFEGMQLQSGTVPTALQLPRFGTLYTESNTILEVETMELTQRRGAIAVGGVTLVVLAGTVTWSAFARTEEAGVGETLRMETADPQPVIMTASRQQALLDENEELRRRLAEAEARASRQRVANEDAAPVMGDVALEDETVLAARFSDDKYGAALAGVDWKVVGTAMKGQVAVSAELAAAILAGEIPLELAGELQQFNGQLVGQLQPLMDGEVPGSGPNGTFTHPLVAANQVDQVLASGDAPLSEEQSSLVAAITDHYLAQDENLRIRAEGHELSLETLLEETAMKDRFYEEVGQVLSPEQHAMLYPDGVGDYNQLNLFGTGIIWAQVAKPALVEGPEDLARRNFSRFSDGLKLNPDQQERLRPLLDTWSRSYPPEYWSETSNALEREGIMKTSRTRMAAERQLALFKSMLNGLGLTAEQREKLLSNNGVLVPMVR